MAFGPIDLIVLEFKNDYLYDEILSYLTELVSGEVIRILDLMMVKKDEHGEIIVQELHELDPAILHLLEPLKAEISGMVTVEDIRLIGAKLRNNTMSAIMLFENLWAVKLKQDIDIEGGRLVVHEHIPNKAVVEALNDLARYD
jgi:hypothetical protein